MGKRRVWPLLTANNPGGSLEVLEFDLKDLFVCSYRELDGREFPRGSAAPGCLGEGMCSVSCEGLDVKG